MDIQQLTNDFDNWDNQLRQNLREEMCNYVKEELEIDLDEMTDEEAEQLIEMADEWAGDNGNILSDVLIELVESYM